MRPPPIPEACPQCGTQVAPGFLVCPACKRLVHSDELKRMAADAERAEQEGRFTDALARWRECLDLLPRDAQQHATLSRRVSELGRRVGAMPAAAAGKPVDVKQPRKLPKWLLWLGPLAPIGLLLLKFKTIIFIVLSKAKFLLLGLTQGGTLFTMLAAFGLYWTVWGWKFALGLVVSIYIHEMGHVWALRQLGIKATAPMFIPGLGAVVLLKQRVDNPHDDARVGLAGPIWGVGAALACFLVYQLTGKGIFGALAHIGGWITLFNLIPVWQLDGGRGFHAMSRLQRWLAVAAIGGAWLVAKDAMVAFLLAGAIYRTVTTPREESSDWWASFQYIGLVLVSALLCRVAPLQ